MGMGTLIIFIAMILVAATAATVLINTTSSLQNRALDVGRMTQDEISTGISLIHINAKNGSSGNSVDDLYLGARLSAGSNSLRFIDVLAVVTLDDTSADYAYNESIDCANPSDLSQNQFGVEYSLLGTEHREGYLVQGDVVSICLQSPRSIGESERFRVSLVPRVGIPTRVQLATPRLILSEQVNLYP